MKKLMYTAFSIAVALLVVSCGSSKEVVKPAVVEPVKPPSSGVENVDLPLTGKEYQSDKEFYRAKSSGKSPDIATARKIALNNAKAEIAGLIKTKLKAVTQNYTNQRSTADALDFGNKFDNLTTEVVSQELVDVAIIGEKLQKTANIYEYHIAIEVSKQSILNGITNSVTKNEKLMIDFEKKKFEEIYNKEMEKLEK